LEIFYENEFLAMMPRKYGLFSLIFLVLSVVLYRDLDQKKKSYQAYQQLQQRYLFVSHQPSKTLKVFEWPKLLKVWMVAARLNHCELILVGRSPQHGFRLKIKGSFLGLQQWLYAVHRLLPRLAITKIVIEHKTKERLQMYVQGYRDVYV
jgi:hypothetical protein